MLNAWTVHSRGMLTYEALLLLRPLWMLIDMKMDDDIMHTVGHPLMPTAYLLNQSRGRILLGRKRRYERCL